MNVNSGDKIEKCKKFGVTRISLQENDGNCRISMTVSIFFYIISKKYIVYPAAEESEIDEKNNFDYWLYFNCIFHDYSNLRSCECGFRCL